MLIQVNTDHNIEGTQRFKDYVDELLRTSLGRFGEQLTRVEVYLSDERGEREGSLEQKRCLLEARLAGLAPLSVCEQGGSLHEVLAGSVTKLTHLLESTLSRLDRV